MEKVELSVSELKEEIQTLSRLKSEHDAIEEILDAKKKELEAKKLEILACLQRNELPGLKVPGVLNVSVRNEFYVKQPINQENEEAFYAWLKENNLDGMRKVNHQSLNALYRERLEAAAEQGDIVVIPGLETPTTRTTLTIRKA